MSNFEFLKEELPILANLAISAEHYLHSDPPISLFKLRVFVEKFVDWIYNEHGLDFPYDIS
jgi:type I restriction enzyme R subunit